MQNGNRKLEQCLIKAGFWSERDGKLGTDEHSLGLILAWMRHCLSRDILPVFYGPCFGHKRHEARLVGRGLQRALASGESQVDVIYKAALALPDFLKSHPECARRTFYASH